MSNQELKRLQKKELEILIDFHNFCVEKNLQYYLIGGALLGAARYQGFIPWDDDIDVAMPREDYERLKKEYRSSDKYFLQNSDTDPLFARGIQKIRCNGTKAVEQISENVNIHHGIYIDIFPIDYVNSAGTAKMASRARLIRALLSLRAIKSGYIGSRYRYAKKTIKTLFPISLRFIDRQLDRLCTMENKQPRKFAILWLHNYSWEKQLHDIRTFEEATSCIFENQCFMAPSDVHGFLVKVFGENYLQEPPEDRRKNPHSYIKVCF